MAPGFPDFEKASQSPKNRHQLLSNYRQCADFMSETTKPCRFERKKSADFGKSRKSFLCRFGPFGVVF